MIGARRKSSIVFIGTSLPRICGLATFSQDLIREFVNIPDFNPPSVVAVNDHHKRYIYAKAVIAQIDQQTRQDYVLAAEKINYASVDLAIIQHEFGIYGGASGEYILDLAQALTVPFMVILHTVLQAPTAKQKHIVSRLSQLSVKTVTMAHNTVADLITTYRLDPTKISVIRHGVPSMTTESRDVLKRQAGFDHRTIISTFGFLSPGKGIEYAIQAMSQVVQRHPKAHYLVLGETHPVVREERGEVYRHHLLALASTLNLKNHVTFVNRLLTNQEIAESLVASDLCLTPYLGKDQAVSGTLAYDIGYGRAVISTPYRYATEMLAEGRGRLSAFRNSAVLAENIIDLLDHASIKLDMETKAQMLGQTMRWSEIALTYAALFRQHLPHQTHYGRML